MIHYKGYTALLEVDVPTGTIVGHVVGIRDEIVFQGRTTGETVEGFHKSVDFYLSRLAEAGQEPERPFSGKFNVRIDSSIHRGLVLDAEARKISLNDVVKRAFAAYLESAVAQDEGSRADAIATTGDQVPLPGPKKRQPKPRGADVGGKRPASKSRS